MNTESSRSKYLTVKDVCADLGVARSTWDDWKVKGKTPRLLKLPNGQIRVRRHDYEDWINTLEEAA